jgi:hypothetical protein
VSFRSKLVVACLLSGVMFGAVVPAAEAGGKGGHSDLTEQQYVELQLLATLVRQRQQQQTTTGGAIPPPPPPPPRPGPVPPPPPPP